MMVLMVYTNLFHFFGNGPFMMDHIPDVDDCSVVWWKHLLYVHNIWYTDQVRGETVCMPIYATKHKQHNINMIACTCDRVTGGNPAVRMRLHHVY